MPVTAFSSSPGKTIRLRDGRSLGYAEYGDPRGQPVLFFHGIPGSRLFHHPDDALTASLGVRLIALDRPGYGLSDFQRNRRLLDWPDDVLQVDAPISMGRYLASAIPHCRAVFCPGEGHLLMFDHWREILTALTHKSF